MELFMRNHPYFVVVVESWSDNYTIYILYYIPVFTLVKSLQIIMRISAQTK